MEKISDEMLKRFDETRGGEEICIYMNGINNWFSNSDWISDLLQTRADLAAAREELAKLRKSLNPVCNYKAGFKDDLPPKEGEG